MGLTETENEDLDSTQQMLKKFDEQLNYVLEWAIVGQPSSNIGQLYIHADMNLFKNLVLENLHRAFQNPQKSITMLFEKDHVKTHGYYGLQTNSDKLESEKMDLN